MYILFRVLFLDEIFKTGCHNSTEIKIRAALKKSSVPIFTPGHVVVFFLLLLSLFFHLYMLLHFVWSQRVFLYDISLFNLIG